MRHEKLKAERVEQERCRQAKAEQHRIEKERTDRERAERREAEKAERAKAAQQEANKKMVRSHMGPTLSSGAVKTLRKPERDDLPQKGGERLFLLPSRQSRSRSMGRSSWSARNRQCSPRERHSSRH